ncbi:MAG: hypothetical protein ACREJD_00590 [Phycisphaerales bacterium]
MNTASPVSRRIGATFGDSTVGNLWLRVSVLAAASLASAASMGATYKLDDGVGSNSLGPSFACEFMWGNIYDVQPGAEVISTISVAFGTLGTPEARPVRVYLYQMVTANDPTDAVLVATATGLSGLPRTNTFLDYPITPTMVHGQFFAAASMEVFGDATVIPARYDKDGAASSALSWFFGADSYLDMPLSQAPFSGSMNNNIIQGVFMVRATGVAPPCGGDLNSDGKVDDSDFVLFAEAYDIFDCASRSMPAGCPADINGDGFVDDSDFALFAMAYDLFVCP